MTGWSSLALESSSVASPIWIRLLDTFTGAPPRGAVSVSIERAVGATWVVFAHRHRIGPSGDLAFVNLGRARDPQTVGTFSVRVTVTSPGSIAVFPGGDGALVTTVTAWAPDAPPPAPSPILLSLYPGPGYAFGAGTPLLAGQVFDSGGAPVARAKVWAKETVQNTDVFEEVRSDGDGRFRLPLRWSPGLPAHTDVQAIHGSTSGSIQVSLPSALTSTHQITLI